MPAAPVAPTALADEVDEADGGDRGDRGDGAVRERWRDRLVDLPREQRWWYLGLTAAVLLVVGSGWYQAFTIPPYHLIDEAAHAGYVLELQDGRLPTIDAPTDAAEGGPVLQEQILRSNPKHRTVWVANNPPVGYVVAVPAATITRAMGLPGGPLLGLRLTNLAAFAAGVVYVGRIGRRLAGGDARVGVLAAATFAAVPHVGVIAGAGFIDGVALVCTLAILDTLIAITRDGPTRRQVVTLALWCGLATGVRPMTAVLAGVAAALALGVGGLRWWRARSAAPSGDGVATPIWSAVVLAVPTVVISGWYYLRNRRLYGDPTGSDRLFEKFERVARPDPLTTGRRTEVWAEPVRTLLNRRVTREVPGPPLWIWHVTLWLVIGVSAVTVVIVVVDQVRARRDGTTARTPLLGWLAAGVLSIVTIALTAQHWTGGGLIHPRYMMFALVVLAVVTATALVRLGGAWPALALVGALLALQAHRIPSQNRSIPRAQWATFSVGSPLTQPIGPTALRYLGPGLVALGVVVLVVAVVGLQRSRPRGARS